MSGDAQPYKQAAAAIVTAHELQGQTITTRQIEHVSGEGTSIGDKADLFIAVGSKAANWLVGRLGGSKPIIYCMVADTTDLQQSKNAYGVTTDVPLGEQVRLIHEALPKATKVGLLYNSSNERSKGLAGQARRSVLKGMELIAVDLADYESSGQAVEALFNRGVDVIWTLPDSSVYDTATTRTLLLRAIRSSTAVFGFSPAFVRAGALLGVGVEPEDQGRQAAEISANVLSGREIQAVAEPASILAVNLTVAEKLSIALPKAMVDRAKHVFGRD